MLDIDRGAVHAHPDGYFELILSGGTVRVPVPRYRMPDVPKLSAGYFAAPGMDLIDLFIGAEGTLGVVVNVTLRIVTRRPAWCLAFVPFADRGAGLDFVRALRDAARDTWRTHDSSGLDVSAIEHLDARCLELAREDGVDRRTGVTWPNQTAIALLITLELSSAVTSDQAFEEIGRWRESSTPETPLARFCRALDDAPGLPGSTMSKSRCRAIRHGWRSCSRCGRRFLLRSIHESDARSRMSISESKKPRAT